VAFRRQRSAVSSQPHAVSVLKPVHGIDPEMREAIRSHTVLEGEYEFLCGGRRGDPAAASIAECPTARLVEGHRTGPNGKVGELSDRARQAHNPILVVKDADMRVDPDYLSRVTAPLDDPKIGVVTCIYRAQGETFPARFESLGISTDFAPSTLVARL